MQSVLTKCCQQQKEASKWNLFQSIYCVYNAYYYLKLNLVADCTANGSDDASQSK